MLFLSWFWKLTLRRMERAAARGRRLTAQRAFRQRFTSLKPHLEVFEDRVVPSAPYVTRNVALTLPENGTATLSAATDLQYQDNESGAAFLTYTITSATTHGTLSLSGTPVVLNGTFTQKDINDGLITYTQNGDEVASDTFGFTVHDDDNEFAPADAFNFTITPVNDAPVVTAPTGTLTVLTAAALPVVGVSVADADIAQTSGGQFRMMLSASHGTVTLGTTTGLTFDSGFGNGSSELRFVGSPVNVNAALATISYQSGAGYTGSDSLTVTADDQGNTGDGGALTNTKTVALNVVAQPTVVFVNAAWAGLTPGVDPDGPGAGTATGIGYDAFTTVQAAVNAVASGGTVRVAAGTYAENVQITKSLSVLGPNAGLDPNTGSRVAEAVLVPAVNETSTESSTSGTVIRVGSLSGPVTVTIEGLTIDGHNAALTSGGRVLNGVRVNTGAGIVNSIGSFDANPAAYATTLIVQNNVIRNLERYGVLVDNVAARTPAAGNIVSYNRIDNIPSGNNFTGGRGRGVAFEENVYGTLSFNVMTRVNVGWQDDNYNLASPGAGTLVDHNEIHTYHRGIFHNLQYQDATAATITNNQIFVETTGDFPASATNFGIELASIQSAVGATVTNNSATGTVFGVLLWNLPSTGSVVVSGGTLSGNQYGVFATSTDPQFGAGAASHSTINGVTVVNPTVAGIAIDTTGTAVATALTITGGTTVTGGAGGLLLIGANSAVTGNTLNDTAFAGQTGQYITLSNGAYSGGRLNATTATFNGQNGSALTFSLEAKVTHRIDDASVGLVIWKAGTIFVTPAASPTATNNDFTRLSNGISAALTGDTIDISGTFDWNEANASAAYLASSTSGDIRGVKLPAGVNNLAITTTPGTAHIIGLGDYTAGGDTVYDAFLFAADQPTDLGNNGLVIEKLNIDDFESAVMLGWSDTGPHAYNGTRIRNNQITVAGDDSGTQNIAVYLSQGTDQQVTNNTITFQADGTRAVGSGARSFGFQNSTTGGTGYDGLLISNNVFQVGAGSTGNENVYGIWENGHNDDNNSHISISNNQFLGRTGDLFDRALVLSSQTSNLLIDTNTFTDVDNVFYIDDFAGPSVGDHFSFTNNTLTRIGGADGVFLRNVSTGGVHVGISWNVNNTIDGFTGVRGLNELSTQATAASRPASAATDIDAVTGTGSLTVAFVNDDFPATPRFGDPDSIGTGIGPVAFGFNTFTGIQASINALTAPGTVNVLAGSYTGGADATAAGKSVILSAGASPAQVTLSGNLALDTNDTLPIEMNGTSAATQYDNFIVAGGVTLGGAKLLLTRGFDPFPGQSFTIIDNDNSDPVSGVFKDALGNDLTEGSVIAVGGIPFRLSYAGGTGNDVTLSIVQPSAVYVNDNWVETSNTSGGTVGVVEPGDTVANTGAGDTGAVTGKVFGYDAFASVQDAINAVAAGGTVNVLAGTYSQAVTVNKSVSLLAEPGVTVSAPASAPVFTVAATNVTIQGFGIQVAQQGSSGVTNAAVRSVTTFDGLRLIGNTFAGQNTSLRAVFLQDFTSTQGVTLQGNTFNGTFNGTTGSYYYRDVELYGVRTAVIGGTNPGEGNTFNLGFAYDLHLNFLAAGATATVQGNTFNGGGINITEPNAGATVAVTGNTFTPISPLFDQALYINHNYTTATVSVSGNTFTGAGTAVYSRGSHNVALTGNTFNAAGLTTFTYLKIDTLNDLAGAYSANDIIVTGNTFNGSSASGLYGNAIAVFNSRPINTAAPDFGTLTVGGAGAAANTFGYGLANIIRLDPTNSSPAKPVTVNIDATGNLFDVTNDATANAVLPTSMPLADLYKLEDAIFHATDASGLGFVRVKASNVFVTQASNSIQRGVDVATIGDTVNVNSGTYSEELTIGKSLSLLGPNALINPNIGPIAAQAVVRPAVSNPDPNSPTSLPIVYITVSGVTIKGFTFDGDNTSITSGVTVGGVDVDAYEAIASYEGVGNIMVTNNIIRNTSYAGLDFYNSTNPHVTTNNVIQNNKLDNIGHIPYGFGIGVLLYNNFYAEVSGNVMTGVRVGVQTGNFSEANSGPAASIHDNDITSTRVGIYHNLHYSAASPFDISNNTLRVADEAGGTRWDAIRLYSLGDGSTPTVSNNTIIATDVTQTTVGYNVWNDTTATPLFITGGSVTGADYGVWVRNYDTSFGNGASTAVTLNRVLITGATQAGVFVEDSALNTNAATVRATAIESAITGSATGTLLSGSDASAAIHGSDLSGNTIAVNNTTSTPIDASGNWWGNANPANFVSKIVGSVVYNPWLAVGDANASLAGFQPDYASLHATTTNEDTVETGISTVGVTTPTSLTSAQGATVTRAGAVFTYDPTAAAALQALDVTESTDDTYTYNFTDVNGSHAATITVHVTGVNDTPVVSAGGGATINEGDTFTRTVTFTDVDASDASWTVTVNYGDGTTPVPFVVTTKSFNLSHTYTDNGNFPVSVAVNDGHGGTGTGSFTVTVNNVAPTAAITGAPATSPEGTPIPLTATVTDPGADTFTYAWSVTKDGNPFATGTTAGFSFTPDDNGTYVVSLTVTDDDGGSGVATPQTITVTNVAPTVSATGPTSGSEGSSVTFTGSFTDPAAVNDAAYSYTWHVVASNGQVIADQTGTSGYPSAVADLTFTPVDNGTYTVSLTVTDNDTGTTTFTAAALVVGNIAPVLTITPSGTITYTENGPALTILPAADTVTITDVGANDTITHASVAITTNLNAGDVLAVAGSLPAGVTASYVSGTGVLTISGPASRSAYEGILRQVQFSSTSDNPTFGGTRPTRTFTIQVQDNGPTLNLSNIQTRSINVLSSNDAPSVTVPAAFQFLSEDPSTPLTLSTGNGNAVSVADPDADPNDVLILLSATHGSLTLSTTTGLSFLFGDGTADASMGFRGTLAETNAALSGLTFAPTANYNGVATVSLTINDEGNTGDTGGPMQASGSVTVVISAVPDAPTAVADSATTAEDTAVTIDVAANDSDADGDTFSVTAVTPGAHGTTQIIAGKVKYTPATDYFGTDTFTYTITDSTGLTGTATVTVTVTPVDDAPVGLADGPYAATEDTPLVVSAAAGVLANDSDVDDPLSQLSASLVASTTHGLVSLNADGSFTYTPAANYFGSDGFTYRVVDAAGAVSAVTTVSLTVTGVNDAPTLDPIADLTVAEDSGTATITLTGITAGPANEASQSVTVTAASSNQALIPDGSLSVSAISGGATTLTFTPAADAFGSATITVTVTDNGGTAGGGVNTFSRTFTVTVTPVNDAPVVSVVDSTAISYTENDAATVVAPNLTVSDVDNANLAGATVTMTGFVPGQDVLAFTPGGGITGTFNAGTGVLTLSGSASLIAYRNALRSVTYVNTSDDPSTAARSVAFAVSDGTLTSAPSNRSITVAAVNDAPVVTVAATPLSYTENAGAVAIDPNLTVSDVDDATLTGATVTLTGFVSGQDVLGFTAVGNITGSVTSGVLTLTGTDTVANYQAALRSVTYTNTSDNPSTAARSVAFTITDVALSGSATRGLTVTAVNDAPVGVADSYSTTEDNTLTVPAATGVLANDTDADNTQAQLSVTLIGQASHGTATLAADGSFTYAPAADYNGTDTFTYRVTDVGGAVSGLVTVTLTITPVNDNPVAVADSAITAEDTAVNVGVLANDTDVDGDTLSITAVTQGTHGSVTFTATGVTYTPAANYNGTDTFTYTISDGHGGTATASVAVTVNPVNDPPVAVADAASTNEDTPVTVTVLTNDTAGPANESGQTLTVVGLTQPAHGSVTTGGTTVFYTPAADFNGTDSFSYTISDGNGATATATVTVTVTPVNDAPVVTNAGLSLAEGATATVTAATLSANDVDNTASQLVFTLTAIPSHGSILLNGVPLTAGGTFTQANIAAGQVSYAHDGSETTADGFTFTVTDGTAVLTPATFAITITPVNDPPVAVADTATTAEDTAASIAVLTNDTDAESDILTVTAMTQPAHGAVTSDGLTIGYTPAANFNGSDTFTYTISDGHGGTSTASVTVTVTPVNDPPVANTDTLTVAEDGTATSDVRANDTDVEGDTLSITAVTQGTHGSVTFTATGVTYTPAADYNGTDTFTYTIDDGNGGTATSTVAVTVTPVNDNPSATADTATTAEDTAVTVSALANDSIAPDTGETLTITAVTQGSHGAVTFNGASVTYTPAADYNGSDTFTYTISDGNGGTATATVTITVTAVNDAPVAVNDTATTAEDTAVTVSVLTNDTDVDGDALSVTAVTQGAHGSVTFIATGVTYTPAANYNGTDSFSYTIDDGNGGTATATVTVSVTPVNDNPVAVADAATVAEDGAVAVGVLGNDTDVDGNTLSITAVTQGAHGAVTFAGTSVTYTPAANYNGPDSFSYTISDGNGGTASATVFITVTPVNDNPVAVPDAITVAEDSGATPVNVRVNDSIAPDTGETLTITAITQGVHGEVLITGGGTGVTYKPAANYNGLDSFTYTISDGHGGTATATVNVTVTSVNDAPVVDVTPLPLTYTENDPPVAIDPGLTVTDVDSANLTGATVTLVGYVPGEDALGFTPLGNITGSFDTLTGVLTLTGSDTVAHYELALRTVSYVNSSDHPVNSPRTVSVVVVDDGAAPSTPVGRPLTVIAVNDTPTAAPDTATIAEDSGANSIDVLTNDTDADLDTLSVTAVTQGTHGTVAFTATGVTYTPAANYFGPDTFTYTISDGQGGIATGIVNVTVTNVPDAPVAAADGATTAEDTPVTVAVLANDTDADGDTLSITAVTQGAHGAVTFTATGVTYTPAPNYNGSDSFTYTINDGTGRTATATVTVTVTPVNDAPVATSDTATVAEDGFVGIGVLANDTDVDGDTLSVTAVTQGAHGAVTFAPTGVVYSPAANYNGADSFSYTVSDGHGGTASATVAVTITPVNDPPVAVADTASTNEDTPVTVAVLANDTDVDGDTLAVSAVTQPTHGSVTTDGVTVRYTPAANYNGPDIFTYTVVDGHGGTRTATVTINVTAINDPPVATADAYQVTAASLTVPVASGVLANDTDTEPGALTVTSFTQPAHGTVVVNQNGSFVYTPAIGYYGPDAFGYVVSDSQGGTASGSVQVTVSYGQPLSNLVGPDRYSVGAGAGGGPVVKMYSALSTTPIANRLIGDPNSTTGIRPATGDVTGDGVADLVTVTGPGAAAVVTVIDGVSGQVVRTFSPFEATFLGGAFVTLGDFNHDRAADIVITPDVGGGPRVTIYDGRSGGVLANFFGIDDSNFRGGARPAAGDLNGDTFADLVISAGAGGGPRISGFDGRTVLTGNREKLFNDFFAFDKSLRNGAYLAVGDVDGDGKSDLITGAGPGGGPNVRIFSGDSLTSTNGLVLVSNFFAGDTSNRGGVRVAVADLDHDNRADLVTGTGQGAGSTVRVYVGSALASGSPSISVQFDPFGPIEDGVYVG